MPDDIPPPAGSPNPPPPAAPWPPNPLIAGSATAASPAAAAASVTGLEATVERLAGELLRQRRSERRWRTFFRLAWLALALAVLALAAAGRGAPVASSLPHTALVELRGEIAAGGEASAELLVTALRRAFENPAAQAVVLRCNSPGGSPVQAGIVYDEIARLKALHRKKFYAVVEEVCASGGYYIAVAADRIYVDKASIVGSIGVLMDGFGFTGLMDKLGVERRLFTAGTNKGLLDPFSPLDPKQVALVRQMLGQVHEQFIAVVRAGRGARLQDTPEVFSGLFWHGEEAVRRGLADQLGTLDQVARDVVQAAEVVDYSVRDNVAERLVKRFGAAVGQGAAQALRGSLSLQ